MNATYKSCTFLMTLCVTFILMNLVVLPVHASHQNDERTENSLEGESRYSDQSWTRYFRRSSESRRAIEDLDDDVVEEIPIPVLFGIELDDIYSDFGDPRGGGTRSHEGQDMLAPIGTPIVSPTEAVVLRTGTGSSAGKYVYTANPGGETFVYMHLDEINRTLDPGDKLKRGDFIGTVGNTGNAIGGPAHLHFEMRKNGAQDPYPRIQKEFDLEEKIEFLDDVFSDVQDEDEMAEFLVKNFSTLFVQAERQDIDLPKEIVDVLGDVSTSVLSNTATVATGDLTIGDSGPSVVALQNFLITNSNGAAHDRLVGARATGYFGPITQAALAEYQKLVGIIPASGYYGFETRKFIEELSDDIDEDVEQIDIVVENSLERQENIGSKPVEVNVEFDLPTYDMTLGARGNGVVQLQQFLIDRSSGVAATRLAQARATGYFGPITQAALVEYQSVNGISPAQGYYGTITRLYILFN